MTGEGAPTSVTKGPIEKTPGDKESPRERARTIIKEIESFRKKLAKLQETIKKAGYLYNVGLDKKDNADRSNNAFVEYNKLFHDAGFLWIKLEEVERESGEDAQGILDDYGDFIERYKKELEIEESTLAEYEKEMKKAKETRRRDDLYGNDDRGIAYWYGQVVKTKTQIASLEGAINILTEGTRRLETLRQDREHEIKLPNGHFVIIEEVRSGVFRIIEQEMATDQNDRKLGFYILDEKDESVKDLSGDDEDVEYVRGLEGEKMSNHLQWEDVEFMISQDKWGRGFFDILTPSLTRIQEALKHIGISSYDPSDV